MESIHGPPRLCSAPEASPILHLNRTLAAEAVFIYLKPKWRDCLAGGDRGAATAGPANSLLTYTWAKLAAVNHESLT